MASVHDVAAYILGRQGLMTAMKLHKLAYYSQAWVLVWEGRPLYPERIEAWANGPAVPELYHVHRGTYEVSEWPRGDASALTAEEREAVDAVLDDYGDLPAQSLSDLTHDEDPWLLARVGLEPLERGNHEITLSSMEEYYGSLLEED